MNSVVGVTRRRQSKTIAKPNTTFLSIGLEQKITPSLRKSDLAK